MNAKFRKQEHLQAKELLRQGDATKALEVLLHAEQVHGPYIGIYCDIAAIQFLKGNYQSCRLTLQKIKNILAEAGPLLNYETLCRSYIFAGKLHEEFAEISQALKYYKAASEIADIDANLKIKARAQLLRILSWLNITTDLPSLYSELSLVRVDKDLQIEVDHALMLAEIQLFGFQTAYERLQILSIRRDLYPHDLKFFLADFAEEIHQRKNHNRPDIILFLKQNFSNLSQSDLSTFEALLAQSIQNNQCLELESILRHERDLTPLDIIRLLALLSERNTNSIDTSEIRQRVLFFIRGTDVESQDLFLKKWNLNQINATKQAEVLYLDKVSLHFRNETLSLPKNSFSYRALELLQKKNKYSLDEFVQEIYGQGFDEFVVEKNRVALSRLNRSLERLTGYQRLIKQAKESVSIQIEIQRKL